MNMPVHIPQTDTIARVSLDNLELRETATLKRIADRFDAITLAEMDSVKLMDRVDRKYVLKLHDLPEILASVRGDYRILSVEGARLNHYRTVYFDTDGFELYANHVTLRKNRYKVRVREYSESRLTFLEVKRKTNNGRTIKTREPIGSFTEMSAGGERLEIELAGNVRRLGAKLWNNFSRMTLVSRTGQERVTIDVGISLLTPENALYLDRIAVAEVKTGSSAQASLFANQMKAYRYHAQSFSKYAVGINALYDGVKKNAMKPIMLQLKKMMGGAS